MTKITPLTDLVNLENQTTAVNAINSNNASITTAFTNTLSRDGSSPNTMSANLDMNNNHIINLPTPTSNYDPVRFIDVTTIGGGGSITVNPLPVGGTVGQVLAKIDSTNFNATWTSPAVTNITVGTTVITGGTNGRIHYTVGGVLGELTTSGSGTVVALQTSPALVTPDIGVATGTQLTLNGATVGGAGMIWGLNTQNAFTSWQIKNLSNGNAASTALTIGNDVATGDFSIWSSTFASALFTNRVGIIAGNVLNGILLTTVGSKSIDFAVANTKVGSFTTGGDFSALNRISSGVAGTVANPSITVGTAGYGFYQPAVNQLGMAVGGGLALDYGITNANAFTVGANFFVQGKVLCTFSLGGVGYGTGAGNVVTQGAASGKATGVTLNNPTGAITMNNAALAASTSVMFTLSNSTIAAADTVSVNIKSGATTLAYVTQVEAVAAGSCNIVLRNVSVGSLSEAVVLTINVIKGSIT